MPLLLLFGVELALRAGGYGYPTRFFLKAQLNGRDVLIQNDRFGWRFFGPKLARTPRPVVVETPKPAGALRVFLFGESAAYGDPKPDFGLPRILEVLLREAIPGRNVEVINVAMTGINSHAILPIARDCSSLEGDLWVVYMGNNEVVGPFGSGTVFGPMAPSLTLVRFSLALKATRVGQLAAALLSRTGTRSPSPQDWSMQIFAGTQVRHADPGMERVYAHFSQNLSDMLEVARRRGTPVVLSTVAANLKDCAPFASLHRQGMGAEQKQAWKDLYEQGCTASRAGDFQEALQKLQAASQIDEDFADLHYEWATAAFASHRREEALRHFSLARDYDTLRFRVDSRLNDEIRQTAARQPGSVFLADSEAVLAAQSPSGILGEELLYEHVHFNWEGNYRLAVCLAEHALKALNLSPVPPSTRSSRWLSSEECAVRLGWTRFEEFKALKSVMLRVSDAPFTSRVNNPQARHRLQLRLEQLLPWAQPQALLAASLAWSNAVALNPGDWVLQRNLGDLLLRQGNFAEAEKCYSTAIHLLPHDPQGYLQLGLLQLQAHKASDAIRQFEQVLRLQPESVTALNSLAVALTAIGKDKEAIESYEQALKLKPHSPETHLNFATALEAWNQPEKAVCHLAEALQYAPSNPDTLLRLGKAAAAHGWIDAALTNFTRAVQLDPINAAAQLYLGSALLEARRFLEALPYLATAVRLDPESFQARVGLGTALLRLERSGEALEHLAKAAALDPSAVDARVNLAFAQLRVGQPAQARLTFEQVLRLDPSNTAAKRFLAKQP